MLCNYPQLCIIEAITMMPMEDGGAMLKEERQKQIVDILRSKGFITVEELCRMFDVTNMTIRRDLDELERKQMLVRSHGGAMLADNDVLVENPFQIRMKSNVKSKMDIAAAAAGMLSDGQKIFIGSGTTTFCMSQKIDNSKKLIVVTDAVNIASVLLNRSSVSVLQIGGEVRSNTFSVTGAFAESMIRKFRFKNAYIGVTGIGVNGQIYVGSVVQLGIYQSVIESSDSVTILADSRKFGIEDFVSIGSLSEKFTLITNSNIHKSFIETCKNLGAGLVTV